MSDIVERLRQGVNIPHVADGVMDEAAAEIERLQAIVIAQDNEIEEGMAEIERLQNATENWKVEALRVTDVANQRQAEIERLRADNADLSNTLNAPILRDLRAEIERLQAVLEEYACPGLKDCSQPKLDDGSCLAEATGGMCGDAAHRALEEAQLMEKAHAQ